MLTHATRWINPEDTELSEISQLQKDNNVNVLNNHLTVHLKVAMMELPWWSSG